MKYGEHLKANISPLYGPDPYLNYELLDSIIRKLAEVEPSSRFVNDTSSDLASRQVSLTTPQPTFLSTITNITSRAGDAAAATTTTTNEETFLRTINSEMTKVEEFTLQKVTQLRQKLNSVEQLIKKIESFSSNSKDSSGNGNTGSNTNTIEQRALELADEIAEDFLRVEKFVNINFMGFHKILKKHDKHMPNHQCKAYYISRMHGQAWVRGDYSDLVVRLSQIYSSVRHDHVAKENQDASQSFLRSTSKYWIKTEDVSRVKYAILKHLPVFLQKTSTGESDSQFTNSVYVDNDQLELYHGRLEKNPGAIALRFRWYGVGNPKTVFVERKTHNEKWMGEVSVKERFTVDESEVHQVLTGTYPIAKKKQEMLGKGKSQEQADEWEKLVTEICQVCVSKQLVPTMRTQCMRTAFQIPFDATVRISLDTNLCMISERGYDLEGMKVWHRDPSWILEPEEIHRFPHAVLEIKLELKGGNLTPPKWVTDLQNSGMLYECHKYSKYCHGCAVLLPEDVQSVPYWVDDASLRESIIASGSQRILADVGMGSEPGANSVYQHLLPFGDVSHDRQDTAMGRTSASIAASKGLIGDQATATEFYGAMDDEYSSFVEEAQENCCAWTFPFCSRNNSYADAILAPTSIQKIEPKLFFANERTFLHYLHYGVILAAVASGMLAFAHQNGETWGEWYAMALLPISLGFCLYALNTYLWRCYVIKARIPARWDDPYGPLVLGSTILVVLVVNFCTVLYENFKCGKTPSECYL